MKIVFHSSEIHYGNPPLISHETASNWLDYPTTDICFTIFGNLFYCSYLSTAFLRHIQYLGFIFIFSVIFYIAGLIIACARRDTFKKIDFKTQETGFSRWDREESEVLF